MKKKAIKSLGNILGFIVLFLLFFGISYLVENATVLVESGLMWLLAGVAVIGGGWQLVGALRASFRIARPDVIDVTTEGYQLHSAQGQRWQERLLEAGFHRAGEYRDPSYGKEAIGYCFFDEKRQTYVEIVELTGFPMLQLTSVFGEKSVVETVLSTLPIPDRNEVDKPTYRLQIVRGDDFAVAYQAHLAATQDFMLRFGEAVSMPPFAEAIIWLPKTYTDRYRRAKFSSHLMQGIGFILFFSGMALLLWLIRHYEHPTDLQFALGLGFLSLIFMTSPMIMPLPRKSVIIFELGMLVTIGIAFSSLIFGGVVGLVYGVSLVACLFYLLKAGAKLPQTLLVTRSKE